MLPYSTTNLDGSHCTTVKVAHERGEIRANESFPSSRYVRTVSVAENRAY